VRRALRFLLDPYPGGSGDVEAVLRVAAGAVATLPLQGGHHATREGPWVALHPAAVSLPPGPVPLAVPGWAGFGDWVLRAEGPGPRPAPVPLGRRHALLDPAVAAAGLTVRPAAPGDAVDTGTGSKPVAEALREAGVPAARRWEWPVVESGGTIAWVAGARLAAWAAPRGAAVVVLGLREAR
jgi:tRNA(Ile)-lysidine synthetase-like protein